MNIKNLEIFDLSSEEIKKYLNDGYKLVLYGAGTAVSSYARMAHSVLKHDDINFDYFIDDDRKRKNQTFLNKKIFFDLQSDDKFIILISSNYFKTIFQNKLFLKKNIIVSSLVRIFEQSNKESYDGLMSYEEAQRRLHTHKSKLYQFKSTNKNEIYLNALDIQVTEKCTMKCKDCSNLMQYYSNPINVDTNNLLNSLQVLINSIDYLADARVLGGEPFIVKELDTILEFLVSSKKVGHITIYTNGTIVPRGKLTPVLKDPKVVIEITDYDEYSKNLNKLADYCTENLIKFFIHKPQNWTDSARIINNGYGDKELSQMFDACCVNDALTLLHGNLYHCPFSANSVNLGSFVSSKEEYINISKYSDSAKLRKKIKSWYFGRKFLDACRFCLGRDYTQPLVEPGVQIKEPIVIPIFAFDK